MSEKQKVYRVVHAGLYRAAGTGLAAVPVGTEVMLTQRQGDDMVKRGMVELIEMPVSNYKPTVKDGTDSQDEQHEEKHKRQSKKRKSAKR